MMMTKIVVVENRRTRKLKQKQEKEQQRDLENIEDAPAATPQKRLEYRCFDLKTKEPAKPGRTCFKCRLPGHLALHCPGVKKQDKKEEDSISEQSTTCSENTSARDSPAQGKQLCYVCWQFGHTRSGCPHDIIRPFPCTICGEGDHLADACKNMRCEECEALGHYASDCPQRKEREEKEWREYHQAREAAAQRRRQQQQQQQQQQRRQWQQQQQQQQQQRQRQQQQQRRREQRGAAEVNASAPKLKKEPMTKKDDNVAAKKKSPSSFALPLPPAPTDTNAFPELPEPQPALAPRRMGASCAGSGWGAVDVSEQISRAAEEAISAALE